MGLLVCIDLYLSLSLVFSFSCKFLTCGSVRICSLVRSLCNFLYNFSFCQMKIMNFLLLSQFSALQCVSKRVVKLLIVFHVISSQGQVSFKYFLRDMYEDLIQMLVDLSSGENIFVTQPCRDNTLYLLKLIDDMLIAELDHQLPVVVFLFHAFLILNLSTFFLHL